MITIIRKLKLSMIGKGLKKSSFLFGFDPNISNIYELINFNFIKTFLKKNKQSIKMEKTSGLKSDGKQQKIKCRL